MNIVFFGTPDYVLPIAKAIHKQYNSAREKNFFAVVTQMPKVAGRKQYLERSAIDKWAYEHKLEIFYDPNNVPAADLGIVAAYGKIIPQSTIEQFKYGILNIHPSLLPKFRGASPIQAAIISGETTTGVSIIKMDEKMDHGDIVSVFNEEVLETDTTESLRTRLFEKSAEFLIGLVPHYISGKITPKAQLHELATFSKILSKDDGFIPPHYLRSILEGTTVIEQWPISFVKDLVLTPTAVTIDRFIRATFSWPGAWSTVKLTPETKKIVRIKILSSHVENDNLHLNQVQLEGKNPVSWAELRRAYPSSKFQGDL